MTAPDTATLPRVSVFPPPALRWRVVPQPEPGRVSALAAALNLPAALASLLVQRGYAREEDARRFLRPALAELSDPWLLAGMARAGYRIFDDRFPFLFNLMSTSPIGEVPIGSFVAWTRTRSPLAIISSSLLRRVATRENSAATKKPLRATRPRTAKRLLVATVRDGVSAACAATSPRSIWV